MLSVNLRKTDTLEGVTQKTATEGTKMRTICTEYVRIASGQLMITNEAVNIYIFIYCIIKKKVILFISHVTQLV